MDSWIIIGIILGIGFIVYCCKVVFRHRINVIMMWTFKIPFAIFSFLDYHLCKRYYTVEYYEQRHPQKDDMIPPSTLNSRHPVSKIVEEDQEEEPERVELSEQETSKMFKSKGNGKFNMSVEDLGRLLRKNGTLKVEENA